MWGFIWFCNYLLNVVMKLSLSFEVPVKINIETLSSWKKIILLFGDLILSEFAYRGKKYSKQSERSVAIIDSHYCLRSKKNLSFWYHKQSGMMRTAFMLRWKAAKQENSLIILFKIPERVGALPEPCGKDSLRSRVCTWETRSKKLPKLCNPSDTT